jgi:glycine/D-amino acid oxidase-like deaminating enzyme
MGRRIVIVGAGVSGCALAAELGQAPGVAVTVIDRGAARQLPGSTGLAPGFVALLSDTPGLTDLARVSTQIYERLEHGGARGFDRIGSLEIVDSPAAVDQLEYRATLAAEFGLTARLVTARQAADIAPELVDEQTCLAALLFAEDGIARARTCVEALAEQARAAGVQFHYATTVTGIEMDGGRVRGVRTSEGTELPADDVVVATGIWGAKVAALAGVRLPLVPVAHPYVRGRARPAASATSPYVSWPEHQVYARHDGDRLGQGAELPWTPAFEAAVQQGRRLLPASTGFEIAERLNGIFSITADNRPLLGRLTGVDGRWVDGRWVDGLSVDGLWAAESLWVTQAAGAARLLARQLCDTPLDGDAAVLELLRPDRFQNQADEELERLALGLYRGIYITIHPA